MAVAVMRGTNAAIEENIDEILEKQRRMRVACWADRNILGAPGGMEVLVPRRKARIYSSVLRASLHQYREGSGSAGYSRRAARASAG